MLDTIGDDRPWITKGAGRSYRDLNGRLLLFRSCGLSYLHVIAGFSAVSWSCLMANLKHLICEIVLQQIRLHLLLSVSGD